MNIFNLLKGKSALALLLLALLLSSPLASYVGYDGIALASDNDDDDGRDDDNDDDDDDDDDD